MLWSFSVCAVRVDWVQICCVEQIVIGLNQAWLVPIQITVIIVLLAETLGTATLSGLAVMLLMLPMMAIVRSAWWWGKLVDSCLMLALTLASCMVHPRSSWLS